MSIAVPTAAMAMPAPMTIDGRKRWMILGAIDGPDDEADRGGKGPERGLQRRQPEDELQVLRDEQEVADDDEDAEEVRAERRAEGADAEQAHVDER